MFLRDNQWLRLELLLSRKSGYSAARARKSRRFIEALLWLIGNERTWHELPARFGKWNTVYVHFRRWSAANLWAELTNDLQGEEELRAVIEKISAFNVQRSLRNSYRAALGVMPAVENSPGSRWLWLVEDSAY